MALSNAEILAGTNDRFRVEFNDGLSAPYEDLDLIASRMSEGNIEARSDELILYLPEFDPELTLFRGESDSSAGVLHEVRMTTDEYSASYGCSLTEMRNPVKREIHATNINKLGRAVNKTKVKLAWEMLLKGDSAKYGRCYDDHPLFDTDHPGTDPYGQPLSQQNLFLEHPLNAESLIQVLQTMVNFCNNVGQPFGNEWTGGQTEPTFRLWHGPALEETVARLKMSDPAAQNPLAGSFVPRKSQYLRGEYAEWWLVQFLTPARPLAFVDVESYLITALGRDSESGRKHKRAEATAHAELGAGYKHWHCFALCKPE